MAKNISRRTWLKILAGAGLSWTALQKLPSKAQLVYAQRRVSKTRQWAMIIDLRKCDGCVSIGMSPQCTEACNKEHFVPPGQDWLNVLPVRREGGGVSFLPVPCMQCENAPCLNVCPVGATFRNDEDIVLVDHRLCIGCRLCMGACPYGVIRHLNWEQPPNPPGATFAEYSPEYPVPHRVGTVEKCMFCAHRTGKRLPACAEGCPMQAIYFGDLVEDIATNGAEVVKLSRFIAENNAFRLKEELGTRPRVWYIPGHGEEFGHRTDDPTVPPKARPWTELEKEDSHET